jgi:hypothetical protein
VARVQRLSGLAVLPTPAGCDLLQILRSDMGTLTIRPARI